MTAGSPQPDSPKKANQTGSRRPFLLTCLGKWVADKEFVLEKLRAKHGENLSVFTLLLFELMNTVSDVFQGRSTQHFENLLAGMVENDPDAHEGRVKLVTQLYFNILQCRRDYAQKEEELQRKCNAMQQAYIEKLDDVSKHVERSITTRGQMCRDREAAFSLVSGAISKVLDTMKSIESTVITEKKRFIASRREAVDSLADAAATLSATPLSKDRKREWEGRRGSFQQMLIALDRIKAAVSSRTMPHGTSSARNRRMAALLLEIIDIVKKVDTAEGRWGDYVAQLNTLNRMVSSVAVPDELPPRAPEKPCRCGGLGVPDVASCGSVLPLPSHQVETLSPAQTGSPAGGSVFLTAGSPTGLQAQGAQMVDINEAMHREGQLLQKRFVSCSEGAELLRDSVMANLRKRVPALGSGVSSRRIGVPTLGDARSASTTELFSSTLSLNAEKLEKRYREIQMRVSTLRQIVEVSGFTTYIKGKNAEWAGWCQLADVPEGVDPRSSIAAVLRAVHEELSQIHRSSMAQPVSPALSPTPDAGHLALVPCASASVLSPMMSMKRLTSMVVSEPERPVRGVSVNRMSKIRDTLRKTVAFNVAKERVAQRQCVSPTPKIPEIDASVARRVAGLMGVVGRKLAELGVHLTGSMVRRKETPLDQSLMRESGGVEESFQRDCTMDVSVDSSDSDSHSSLSTEYDEITDEVLDDLLAMNNTLSEFRRTFTEILNKRVQDHAEGWGVLNLHADKLLEGVAALVVDERPLREVFSLEDGHRRAEAIAALGDICHETATVFEHAEHAVIDLRSLISVTEEQRCERNEEPAERASSPYGSYSLDLVCIDEQLHRLRCHLEGLDPYRFDSEMIKKKRELRLALSQVKGTHPSQLNLARNSLHRLHALRQVRTLLMQPEQQLEKGQEATMAGSINTQGTDDSDTPETMPRALRLPLERFLSGPEMLLKEQADHYSPILERVNVEINEEKQYYLRTSPTRSPKAGADDWDTVRWRRLREVMLSVRSALESVHKHYHLQSLADSNAVLRALSNKLELEAVRRAETETLDVAKRVREFIADIEKKATPQQGPTQPHPSRTFEDIRSTLNELDASTMECADESPLEDTQSQPGLLTAASLRELRPTASFRTPVSPLTPLGSDRVVEQECGERATIESCLDFAGRITSASGGLQRMVLLLEELAQEVADAAVENPALEMRDLLIPKVGECSDMLHSLRHVPDPYFLLHVNECLQRTKDRMQVISSWEKHPAGNDACRTRQLVDECVSRMEKVTLTRQGFWDEERLTLLGIREEGWEKLVHHIRAFEVAQIFKPTLRNQVFEMRRVEKNLSVLQKPPVFSFGPESPAAGEEKAAPEAGVVAVVEAPEAVPRPPPQRPRTAHRPTPATVREREKKEKTQQRSSPRQVVPKKPVLFDAAFVTQAGCAEARAGVGVDPILGARSAEWRPLLGAAPSPLAAAQPQRLVTLHSSAAAQTARHVGRRNTLTGCGVIDVRSARHIRQEMTADDDSVIETRRPPLTARPQCEQH